MKAIVDKLRAKLPQTKVLVLAVFPRGAEARTRNARCNEKTNAIIAKLADNKNVFYLDIGQKFLKPDGPCPRISCPTCCTPTPRATRSGRRRSSRRLRS